EPFAHLCPVDVRGRPAQNGEFLAGPAALTPGWSTHLRRHDGALYKIRARPGSTKLRSDRLRASWSRTSATVVDAPPVRGEVTQHARHQVGAVPPAPGTRNCDGGSIPVRPEVT